MQSEDIARVISEVLKRLEKEELGGVLTAPAPAAAPSAGPSGVVHPPVDAAVQGGRKAQAVFQDEGLEVRREVIRAMRKAAIANAERLAKMAVQETGLGRWEDKVQKNLVCATRTPGVEDLVSRAYTGDKGLTLVEYAPYGV